MLQARNPSHPNEASADVASKKSLPSNEASADVAASEAGSHGSEIPIPQKGMEKSVHVLVKRVLRYAKLH